MVQRTPREPREPGSGRPPRPAKSPMGPMLGLVLILAVVGFAVVLYVATAGKAKKTQDQSLQKQEQADPFAGLPADDPSAKPPRRKR